ncbi:hypothetical protein JMF97_15240 [Micromonospora fiedleri]|uniref:DUF4440 domain-containing protein n=1 Tax=Micromonospora fiedleri TaxID=1157498 RepID=A0ABS1UMH0_9ACTN|nr:hypothetical protein [Micromonospora fiedleri]MBL6277513.1 hypothetical protein [Micromonospora fiedleri]
MKTVEAGRGEATPVAAADAYLLAVFASTDGFGVDRCVCDDRRSELLADADLMRRQVAATGRDFKVQGTDWKAIAGGGTVSAQVKFIVTDVDAATGRVLFVHGTAHEWVFHTKRERGIDGGWKVCRIDAPPLCGTHIRC